MNVLLIGATGGTGRHVLTQALAAGHTVTALARRPDALTARHARLRVVRGDVRDAASLDAALGGQDAVLSALGQGTDVAPTTLYSDGASALIAAMDQRGVRRLIAVSSGGVEDPPHPVLLYRLYARVAKPRFEPVYADMRRMEAAVCGSDLEWTLVRPAYLTDAGGGAATVCSATTRRAGAGASRARTSPTSCSWNSPTSATRVRPPHSPTEAHCRDQPMPAPQTWCDDSGRVID